AIESLRGDGEIFGNATRLEFLCREELGEIVARPSGETLATFTAPSVLGQLVDERAETAAVGDGYLNRVIHRSTARATPMPARAALTLRATAGRTAGGDA